ncbi:MAG TPA: hypothetical protein VF331_10325 [Polyangiales bacterium]
MGLVNAERKVQAVCLRAQPDEATLAQLGDRRVWLIYREMVRSRLREEIELGLSRTCRAAGSAAVGQALERYLEVAPPRTRLFREVACHFARSVAPWWRADPSVPAYLAELCAYEAAVWEVADLDARVESAIAEFAFDKAPVLSPALRLLQLSYVVHQIPSDEAQYAAETCWIAVHRPADDQRVQPWRLNQLTYDLLARWQVGGVTITQATEQVARAHGRAVDATFVDGLCTVLADFIDKGIILGSAG